jgi:hypothetical protein
MTRQLAFARKQTGKEQEQTGWIENTGMYSLTLLQAEV